MPADRTPSYGRPMENQPSFEVPPVRVRDIMLGSGPRFARDAMGPMLAFYVGWRLVGLVAGIVLATVAALAASHWERQHERSGLMARIGLGMALFQAVVGLASGSERLYLAQPVIINGLYGLAFVGSVVLRRPLAGAFADEMYPFPDFVRSSATFRHIFGRVSLVWGVYLLARSGLRLATLQTSSVEAFLGVNFITGMPLTALLLGWSVWYAVRAFRTSEEWGPAIQALEEAGYDVMAVDPSPAPINAIQ